MPKVKKTNSICTRSNCFANKGTLNCRALKESILGECPFYKTEAKAEEDRKKAHEKLVKDGRYDLIQKYEFFSGSEGDDDEEDW